MNRDYRVYFDDIIEAIEKVLKYTEGQNIEEFSADSKTVDAVIRNFLIIGEAVKHIPEIIKEQNPEIPWRGMAGMRDKLVHEYYGIKYDVIWDTIINKLPNTKTLMEELLKKMEY